MKFEELLKILNGESIFSSSTLLAGNISVNDVRKQLTRWVSGGKLIQLRRGIYAVAFPYKNIQPHPFIIANKLKKASYISLQSALEYYGMIPEYVPVITSVTTGRAEEVITKIGRFQFRHTKKDLFWGYKETKITSDEKVFIASPEKSLLDLLYLTSQSDNTDYIDELRLQNMEKISPEVLKDFAQRFGTSKIKRASKMIINLMKER